jgi:resuscitation-promoting factor RpfB
VSLAAGAVAFAQADKSVNLSVDGKTSAVHLIGRTIGDVLASQKITVGLHDAVAPAAARQLWEVVIVGMG